MSKPVATKGSSFSSSMDKKSSLYISPNWYNAGIGSELYKTCEKTLRAHKAKRIKLWVLDTNQKAINFYQKHGFSVTGKTNKEATGEMVLTDLEFEKNIKPDFYN